MGSKIRTYNLLAGYAALGPVDVICFSQEEADASRARELSHVAASLTFVPLQAGGKVSPGGFLHAVRQGLNPVPAVVRAFDGAALRREVTAALGRNDYTFVHIERVFIAPAVLDALRESGSAPRVTTVLDVDDVESSKVRRQARVLGSGRILRKAYLLAESLKLKRIERAALDAVDAALVCSSGDLAELQSRGGRAAVHVVPNGTEIRDGRDFPGAGGRDADTLLFLGAMGYAPNEDAVLHFAADILPLVERRIPGVRLLVAGGSPSDRVRSLHDGKKIVIAGFVEDKDRVLESAALMVVPLRMGGGTRIKILDAMTHGCPVVSTHVGCEGLDVNDGADILIADGPQEFAEKCIRALRDAGLRQALAAAGWNLVRKQYDWKVIRSGFTRTLRGLAARRTGG